MHCIDGLPPPIKGEVPLTLTKPPSAAPTTKPPSAAPGAPTTTPTAAQGRTVVATVVPTPPLYEPPAGIEMAEVLIPYQSIHATVVQQQYC